MQIVVLLDAQKLRFAAKWTAISTKMRCILHQNAVHFAPKRSAFCIKTQGILHQNARHFASKRESTCINIHCMQSQKCSIGVENGCRMSAKWYF